MCECGRKTYCKGMCRSCYEKSRYQPLITAAVPPTTPCTYDAAHQRVYYYRGRARERVCPCGAQAEEWSYRGGSSYEMQGVRERRYARGRIDVVHSTWSTNITDYDALCHECHVIRDSKPFSDAAQRVPGVPAQRFPPAAVATSQEAHNGR